MNKNFAEKFSTVENIVFLIFLFAFPTAFYLYNYSACAALGLEREAFYFCLELVVLFGLLFIIFSCFPHHFVRPMLTKNIFFVFSIIFIPWICYYANATYFYAPYRGILLYGIILTGSLCLFMPNVREVQANAKAKSTILDNIFTAYVFICPLIIASYLAPLIHTAEVIDDLKFLFIFSYWVSLMGFMNYCLLLHFKFLLPHFLFFKNCFIILICFLIPPFTFYCTFSGQMLKYFFILLAEWIICLGLVKFILLDLPTNEDWNPSAETPTSG